jgi:hypothetical protein
MYRLKWKLNTLLVKIEMKIKHITGIEWNESYTHHTYRLKWKLSTLHVKIEMKVKHITCIDWNESYTH